MSVGGNCSFNFLTYRLRNAGGNQKPNNLEGWGGDMGGREVQEGRGMRTPVASSCCDMAK